MSIYKEYRLQPSIPHQCMHYSEKSGDRCRARAMHNEIMCFQHRVDDIPTVLQNDPFELASLYDRASIQLAVTEIAGRLAANHMDLKRAALLLQSCQIAATNLTAHDRAAVKADTAATPLAPPSTELDPNPDPEALRRDQYRRAELGLDELAVPGPKLVILSDPEPVKVQQKDPDASQTVSAVSTVPPPNPLTADSRPLTADSQNPNLSEADAPADDYTLSEPARSPHRSPSPLTPLELRQRISRSMRSGKR